MALWYQEHFSSAAMMIDRLNGAIIGTVDLHVGADVDGLTFIYDIGGGNVTVNFTAAKGRPWTLDEIVAKINASINVASVHNHGYGDFQMVPAKRYLKLIRDGTFTVKSTGTANELLGFDAGADTVNEPITASTVKFIGQLPVEGKSWVVVWGV